VRESTQIGGQQPKKFNLYDLPDILGSIKLSKLPDDFRTLGFF
jgi:hypothetical protein